MSPCALSLPCAVQRLEYLAYLRDQQLAAGGTQQPEAENQSSRHDEQHGLDAGSRQLSNSSACSSREGLPDLRIIVGRGVHSYKGGVLREAAEQILDSRGIAWHADCKGGRLIVRGEELERCFAEQRAAEYDSGLSWMVTVQGLKIMLACAAGFAFYLVPSVLGT